MNRFAIQLNRVRNAMERNGYFPPRRVDLSPNRELVQVVIDNTTMRIDGLRLLEFGIEPGTTVVTLADVPVSYPAGAGQEVVRFRCVKPAFAFVCSVPLSEFLAAEFEYQDPTTTLNIARYYVKS